MPRGFVLWAAVRAVGVIRPMFAWVETAEASARRPGAKEGVVRPKSGAPYSSTVAMSERASSSPMER
jgi:hypothetical protein